MDPFAASRVMQTVARRHGITVDAMRSVSRDKPLLAARIDAINELRAMGMPLSAIARQVGRDHSTVLYVLNGRRRRR